MLLSDINPFMSFAQLQQILEMSGVTRAAYDHRLFYILDGSAELIMGDERTELEKGAVLFLRSGQPYELSGKIKIIVLNFDLTREHTDISEAIPPSPQRSFEPSLVLEKEIPRELLAPVTVKHAIETEALFQKCVTEFDFGDRYSDANTSALIKQILCTLLELNGREPRKSNETVRQVMLYIRANFDRELTNTEIASVFGYHPFYLNRIFKESTGKTLHRVLTETRVENAKALLTQSELPIENVCWLSGFGDRTQFATVFKRYVGITPSEYRSGRAE